MDISGPTGFESKIGDAWVFEIGNSWLARRIHCIGGRIGTTSLSHGVSGEEYLESVNEEFSITVSHDGERRELSFRDFIYTGHSLPKSDEEVRILKIDLEAELDGSKLPISVFYEARADKNFMRKWIEIHPVPRKDWVIEWVTLENLKFKETIEGIAPVLRYTESFPNGEDNVHVEPDKVQTEEPNKRTDYGDKSRSIVAQWGLDEGFFFFTASILGSESFVRGEGLLMRQKDYAPLSEGLTTGAAIIGTYSGAPGIGLKRYTEFLKDNWCVVDQKPTPVSWNTWMVTTKNDCPIMHDYNRYTLLEYLDYMRDAGFYDVLHLDLGWEAGWPMAPDRTKFPNGLDEIVHKARDYGLDMGFWVNPFSSNYWKSDVEEEHQEWLNPGKVSGESAAHAICPMTDYYQYVCERFEELINRYNARVIYWDGGDWNIPECTAINHQHRNQHELEVKSTKRLAKLADMVHKLREDALIVSFNLPMDNHRLSALDREEVSDTYAYPTGQSELIQRQQIYQMTFEHPYSAIAGSWHGVNWLDAGPDNLNRPIRELIHAELSMIGNGACQAGASIDLARAKPGFVEILRKMFTWRKRFEPYFSVYQHILGFPDGENIDGEGHIIDGKGFLILINPTNEEKSVNLPLDEPELELSAGKSYEITDWSDLQTGKPLDKARVGAKYELTLAQLEVKIIGVDISNE